MGVSLNGSTMSEIERAIECFNNKVWSGELFESEVDMYNAVITVLRAEPDREKKEYIERDALIDELDKRPERYYFTVINEAPAADVEPVERGEWKWHEEWSESTPDGGAECQSAGWLCSECGIDLGEYLTECGEHCYFDNADEQPKLKHCPNCGAKMMERSGSGE